MCIQIPFLIFLGLQVAFLAAILTTIAYKVSLKLAEISQIIDPGDCNRGR